MKLISNIISVLAFSGAAVATQAAERPNVIIVFIDDFGYGDLGCYGSTKHRTPHIDQMAKEGIRLTDFYCGFEREHTFQIGFIDRVLSKASLHACKCGPYTFDVQREASAISSFA